MNSRKIIHVVGYYLPHLGGMEVAVNEIVSAQVEAGMDVRVITSAIGRNSKTHNDREIEVVRLRGFEIFHTPIIPGLLWQLLHIDKKSIVHSHIASAFSPEAVYVASKIRRFPYVAHVHMDVKPSGKVGFLLRLYKPALLKLVLRSASSVIVFNEDQRKFMAKKYNINLRKIEIVPNGVNKQYYYSRNRRVHSKPKLLFVGRLGIQKNVNQLLKALDGISKDFQTYIVGDGELRPSLMRLSKKLNLSNITFYGRANGHKLVNLYRTSDVFVLPSSSEGMPLVLLEAMASGLPIVANNVVGVRNVVDHGHNGILCSVNNYSEMQAAIQLITSDNTGYQKMSQASSKMAKGYSWESTCTKLSRIYYEIDAH